MARYMETSRSFANHLNEFVLGSNRLLKPYVLIRLLNCFDDGFLLFLEFQWYQTGLAFIKPFYKNGTRVEKSDINLRLILVLLVNE